MSQIAMITLITIICAVLLCILLYLALEKKILVWCETRKKIRAFKNNKKLLDMLYNNIMFKKSVLDEDNELTQLVEEYPCLSKDVEEYRQFRDEWFTGDIIKLRDDYNRDNNGGQQ